MTTRTLISKFPITSIQILVNITNCTKRFVSTFRVQDGSLACFVLPERHNLDTLKVDRYLHVRLI